MPPPVPVIAYSLRFNEARQIRAVLESVKWANEIIVVDSFATDGTEDIALIVKRCTGLTIGVHKIIGSFTELSIHCAHDQ